MISVVIISKDEPSLEDTLVPVIQQASQCPQPAEVVVIDASGGRLDDIRLRHEPYVDWIDFKQPPGVRVSIPHQRNAGVQAARGEIIVFTDAGCLPEKNWLVRLTAPLLEDEHATAGLPLAAPASTDLYDRGARQALQAKYLKECPTISFAFRREAFKAVDGFDETFAYGSDIDFSWRLVAAGYRIRGVPEAIVRHDFGGWRRQLRRSHLYGRARVRLYRKHPVKLRRVLRDEPMVVAYPVFILGLPLTVIFPWYPALLLIPAWRNRSNGAIRVLADHLTYGAGILRELMTR